MACIAGVVSADSVYFSLSQHLIYNFIFTQSPPNNKPRLLAGFIVSKGGGIRTPGRFHVSVFVHWVSSIFSSFYVEPDFSFV
jgi:hypothetical protein